MRRRRNKTTYEEFDKTQLVEKELVADLTHFSFSVTPNMPLD